MRINNAGGANRILYGEGAPADTLELGYIYVDQLTGNIYGYSPTGNVLIGGPDFHIQDTDQLLDEGGANEVAVADIKSAVDASHTRNGDTKLAEGTGDEVTATELRARLDEALFSGSFDDLTDKPVTIPSPPTPLKLRTYNGVSVKQIDTITLTGTDGTADVTGAGGLTKTATFNTSLTQTAADFVTSHAAAYLAEGIVITSDGANIIFTAETAGIPFVEPAITTVTGTLTGTVVNTQANQTSEEFWTDEHIWAMNVHEGRFSATYNGAVTKMWLFPAGTTDTVSGLPIRTSLADTVDVQIPSDGGTVYLAVEEWDSNPAITFTIIESHGTPGNKVDMFYKHLGELDLSADNSFKGAWPVPDGTYYMCEKMDLSGTAMTGAENAITLANLASYWAGKTVTGGIITLNNNAAGLDAQTDIDTLTTAGFTVSAVLLPSSEPVGSGTSGDPYLISTLEELTWITVQCAGGNTLSGKYFKQTADIDASDTQTWNGGWLPIGNSTYPFEGFYDGDNKYITKLYINRTDSYIGLFSYIGASSYIKNLRLTGIDYTGGGYTGGLVGKADSTGIIENVYIEGSISPISNNFYYGGIVGYLVDGRLSKCKVDLIFYLNSGNGTVFSGIAGKIFTTLSVFAEKCHVNIMFDFTNADQYDRIYVSGPYMGNRSGYIFKNSIMESSYRNNGLTVSSMFGTHDNCNYEISIQNCIFVGKDFNRVLSGSGLDWMPEDVFYDSTLSPSPDASDIKAGYSLTPKTTTELKTSSTYDGTTFDFSTVWAIDPLKNDGYPYLQWEEEEGLI